MILPAVSNYNKIVTTTITAIFIECILRVGLYAFFICELTHSFQQPHQQNTTTIPMLQMKKEK